MTQKLQLFLPSLDKINQELVEIINQRVLEHLENILKDVAKDHFINYQQLNHQYLAPLKRQCE